MPRLARAEPRCHARMTAPSSEPAPVPAEPGGRRKKLKFPTAFTVLAAVLLLVWVASFFVPAGAYQVDPETDGPVPGTYRELPSCSDARATSCASRRPSTSASSSCGSRRRTASTGSRTSAGSSAPTRQGVLYGSAMIFLFVLAVGAFITVTMKTGAIQTGIGRLALRFRHSGSVLIAILMGVFALGGTTLRDVGGDARLLRPARPADARARLRPDGRRVDHLPRRRARACCARRSTRSRPASPPTPPGISLGEGIGLRVADVARARADGDRLRHPVRAPGQPRPAPVGRRDLADRRGGRARA